VGWVAMPSCQWRADGVGTESAGVLMPDSAEQSQYHSKDACVKRGWNLKFQQRLLVSARYGIPQIFTNYTLECGLHCEVTIETPKC